MRAWVLFVAMYKSLAKASLFGCASQQPTEPVEITRWVGVSGLFKAISTQHGLQVNPILFAVFFFAWSLGVSSFTVGFGVSEPLGRW